MKALNFFRRSYWKWLLGAVGLTLFFFAITYLGWSQKAHRIPTIMQVLILLGVCVTYGVRKRWQHGDWLVASILFAGVVMRVGYSLYTPTTLRFHDLAPIDINATGHAGYVLNLFENGALPPSNAFQFAQPPLYYALAALSMKLYQGISGITNSVELFEAVRLVSCIASIATLLTAYRICRELNLGRNATRIALCICAFLPNHYLLAGRANPDGLAVFFCFWIVLYALRWRRIPSHINTVALALGFGLGMMVKMTVAVFALPVGILFAVRFWQRCVRKGEWRFAAQFMLFLVIAAPLGLWHPIRNILLYGQSVVNVFEMSPRDPQYIGNLSIVQRYLLFNPTTLFQPLYIDWATGTNIILYTFKSSAFGEFTYNIVAIIPQILLCSNIALILLSVYATLRVSGNALREHKVDWLFLLAVWFAVFVAYLLFTLRYPFCCSLDFRYMVPASLVGALMLARVSELGENGSVHRVFTWVLYICVAVFSLASIAMYTLIA